MPRRTTECVATVNERYGKCASASNRTLNPTGLESRTGLTQGAAHAPGPHDHGIWCKVVGATKFGVKLAGEVWNLLPVGSL